MSRRPFSTLGSLIFLFPTLALAQVPATQPAHFAKTITKTLEYDYLVYLPKTYSPTEKSPLIVFLHGSGECGHNLSKVAHTPVLAYAEKTPDFPFVVVVPQAHSEKEWWPTESLNAFLDHVLSTYNVDPDRVYLTGLSMGAYGVWDWACQSPDRFAAIVPFAGEGNDDLAGELKHVPVWAWHGADDKAVSPAEEVRMVNAVNRKGGSAKLTMLPNTGHGGWNKAFANPDLYSWLLQHRRYHPPLSP